MSHAVDHPGPDQAIRARHQNALTRHGYKRDMPFLYVLSGSVLLLSYGWHDTGCLTKVDGWKPRVDGTASDSPGPLVPNFDDCPRLGCQPPTPSNHAPCHE